MSPELTLKVSTKLLQKLSPKRTVKLKTKVSTKIIHQIVHLIVLQIVHQFTHQNCPPNRQLNCQLNCPLNCPQTVHHYVQWLLKSYCNEKNWHSQLMSKRIFLFLLFQVCQYSSATTTPKMNKLGEEKSPYLLQHAANPVNWYPWGEQAFAAARESNKLIFLSVGYSTCHWCHVMERESFENQEVIIFTFYACLWENYQVKNVCGRDKFFL